jgi:hypothetical protein
LYKSRSRTQVDRAMLGSMTRSGAASPVRGMNREEIHQLSKGGRIAAVLGGIARDDRSGQNRDEGRAFDQRIAARQLGLGEVIGQDAVFDRPEQRRDDTDQEQGHEQENGRVEPEAGHRDAGNRDLGELEPLGHERLVEAVRDLAADRGEDERRKDEDRGRERDQGLRVRHGPFVEDQEGERVLEEIVVEGAEELAPEQGRKPTRGKKAVGHAKTPAVRNIVPASQPTHSGRLCRRHLYGTRRICVEGGRGGFPVRSPHLWSERPAWERPAARMRRSLLGSLGNENGQCFFRWR